VVAISQSLSSFTLLVLVFVVEVPQVAKEDIVSSCCWPISTIGTSLFSVLSANSSGGGGFCEGQPAVELLIV
jgi:hypothetical protein